MPRDDGWAFGKLGEPSLEDLKTLTSEQTEVEPEVPDDNVFAAYLLLLLDDI